MASSAQCLPIHTLQMSGPVVISNRLHRDRIQINKQPLSLTQNTAPPLAWPQCLGFKHNTTLLIPWRAGCPFPSARLEWFSLLIIYQTIVSICLSIDDPSIHQPTHPNHPSNHTSHHIHPSTSKTQQSIPTSQPIIQPAIQPVIPFNINLSVHQYTIHPFINTSSIHPSIHHPSIPSN